MLTTEFTKEVDDLVERLLAEVETYMTTKGHAFNREALMTQGSIDVGQFAREAFFLGAEVFPAADVCDELMIAC